MTDSSLRLTFVGTGTVAPSAHRVQSATLLEFDDVRLLVDCGSGSVHRLAALGLPWQELTHVALTHFHADHSLDLPTLVFAWRYGMEPPRSAGVTLLGPVGIESFVQRLEGLFHLPMQSNTPPLLVRGVIPGEQVTVGQSATLDSFKVPHTPESLALSISIAGHRIVFSGDTGYSDGFATWAVGADVLVLECSLPNERAMPIHLTPAECARIAVRAQPSTLVLTHFYPPVERVDIISQIRPHFAGEILLAEDGMVIERRW